MAISRLPGSKEKPRFLIVPLFAISACALALLWVVFSVATPASLFSSFASPRAAADVVVGKWTTGLERKFLYWGNRIDCPGKHCDSCAGLGHQESSLRCALEEALFLQRVFVMPSRMCLSAIHNRKGILHQPNNASSDEMCDHFLPLLHLNTE